MKEPSMKQVWAGMAMMALLEKRPYDTLSEIANSAWEMADLLEKREYELQRRSEDASGDV